MALPSYLDTRPVVLSPNMGPRYVKIVGLWRKRGIMTAVILATTAVLVLMGVLLGRMYPAHSGLAHRLAILVGSGGAILLLLAVGHPWLTMKNMLAHDQAVVLEPGAITNDYNELSELIATQVPEHTRGRLRWRMFHDMQTATRLQRQLDEHDGMGGQKNFGEIRDQLVGLLEQLREEVTRAIPPTAN